MSGRHNPHTSWRLFVFAAALLLIGGAHSVLGQKVPVLESSGGRISRSSNPKTSQSKSSARHTDNRAKPASSSLPQPPPAAASDEKRQDIDDEIAKGNQARDNNNYKQALDHYQKAQALNTKEARAFYGLGNVYSDLYCHDSAIKAYLEALRRKNDYVEALVGLGYAYVGKERYDDASEQFHAALAIAPNNADANVGLGHVFMKKGDYPEAVARISLVVNDQSAEVKDRAAAHVALGGVNWKQEKWTEAIAQYQQAISLLRQVLAVVDPDVAAQREKETSLKTVLAKAHLSLGVVQMTAAHAQFSTVSADRVTVQDRERLAASAKQAADNFQDAMTKYEYSRPDAYLFLSYALMFQARYESAVSQAETYLGKVKELESGLPSLAPECDYGFSRLKAEGYSVWGFLYLKESTHQSTEQRKTELINKAIEKYREAIKVKQDYGGAYGMLGLIYLHQGNFKDAVEHYEKAIIYTTDKTFRANNKDSLAMAYTMIGDMNKASENLQQAIELDPRLPFPHVHLANIYSARGQYDEAIESLKKAVALKPEVVDFYYHLASGYYHRALAKKNEGDYEEAIRILKTALGINPKYGSAYFLLAQIYRSYKGGAMTDEALPNFEKAIEYEPGNPSFYYAIGSFYYYQKSNDDEAIRLLKLGVKYKEDDAKTYWLLGQVYYHKKDYPEAIKQLLAAIKYDPKHLQAHLDVASIYKIQKNYAEATKYLTIATNEIAPRDFQPYKELAKLYEEQGRNEDAIHYYEEALSRLDAQDTSARNLYLGRIARLKGQYAEAAEYFRKVNLPGEPGQPYFEIGVMYVLRNDKRAALEQHQQLVKLKSSLAEELLKKIKEMK